MSRHDAERLADITSAIEAIQGHLTAGDLYNGLVYDAVRVRLIEIGEAVKSISPDLLATAPEVPWSAIARMRDHLAHHYFDTDHAIVVDVVENELPALLEAVESLVERIQGDPTPTCKAESPPPVSERQGQSHSAYDRWPCGSVVWRCPLSLSTRIERAASSCSLAQVPPEMRHPAIQTSRS